MDYLEFRLHNFKRALSVATKIYGYKTLSLKDFESHVKEYAEDICKGWYVEQLMANAEYVGWCYTYKDGTNTLR